MPDTIPPPTSRLPSIRKIGQSSPTDLRDALEYLRSIYNPPVRGSRRRGNSSHSSAVELLRSDNFERNYSIRWLTTLISQAELWESNNNSSSHHDMTDITQNAASLLAICAGTAGAGVISRVFSFSPSTEVILTDVPLDNQDFASVGAQTWGGACVLAEEMVAHTDHFGLGPRTSANDTEAPLRVLELGAGTGLVSLVVCKLSQDTSRPTQIIATDFYPSVLANLAANISSNFPSGCSSTSITAHFLDWSTFHHPTSPAPPFDAPFDVIFGADIVYEADHAVWIQSCVATLLRKDPACFFHLVIPLRASFSAESRTVESVFSTMESSTEPEGQSLVIFSKETIVCEGHDAGDDVEYAYYKIGWKRKHVGM